MNKFRAFDPTTGKMYYPPNEHIYLNIDGTCINFQNGEELEVMFWTTATSKTNNEIYDCDIVLGERKYSGKVVGYVEWNGEGFDVIDKNTACGLDEFNWLLILGNTKQNKIEDFQ